ncbi:Uncharacterised protein [Paenibacillus thiaminolyticus]|nr:Uncharacterised protein [Paenibacillus thiaminolyticus]
MQNAHHQLDIMPSLHYSECRKKAPCPVPFLWRGGIRRQQVVTAQVYDESFLPRL